MEKYKKSGFVRSDDLTFDRSPEGYVALSGRIECVGWIYISVSKRLTLVGSEAADPMIRRERYSYSVVLEGMGNILRYDGPHKHRPVHHVHSYDPFESTVPATITELTYDNEQPTLGQVIAKAEGWFYDNVDELVRRRVGDLPPMIHADVSRVDSST